MRTVTLSDHPSDRLRQLRQDREKERDRTRSSYERSLAQHRRLLAQAADARDQARARHRWLAWLRGVIAVRRQRRRIPDVPDLAGAASDAERAHEAGIKGEQQVADDLGRRLGSEWVLLRGYRNKGGEIDHLLLGPRGLAAIEVKYRRVTVYCDGDNWYAERYDKYGNLVEPRAPMRDGSSRGRSPSEQVNEPAGLLESLLRARGYQAPLLRFVLLTHPRARIGECKNPTVRIGTGAADVLDRLARMPASLDATRCAEIESLLVRTHQAGGPRRPARPA